MSKQIPKENIEDILSLSPMQEGMLFHYLRDRDSGEYLEQLCLEISGPIIPDLLNQAFLRVIENNEILRAVFLWENSKTPLQIILKEVDFKIRYEDLSTLRPVEKDRALSELEEKDKKNYFDLWRGPLFRVILCKLTEDNYKMIITNHHILYDGWSNGIILKEVFSVYNSLVSAEEPVIVQKTRFKDYLKWCQNQDKGTQKEFWSQKLRGFDTTTKLPTDIIKTTEISKVEDYTIPLSAREENNIKELVNLNKLTYSSLFYTIWGILLQKYNNHEDVIFGTTVSGRPVQIKGIEEMVGLFINTLPLRVQNKGQTVIALMEEIQKTVNEFNEYMATPLVDIKSYSEVSGNLFDSIMVIENYPLDKDLRQDKGIKIKSYHISSMTNFDLTIAVTTFDEFDITFSYKANLFKKETIERMGIHFLNIVNSVLERPAMKISEISLVSAGEKEKLLFEFNNTPCEYPAGKTIQQIFEEQVQRNPENIALRYKGKSLTYGELNKKANQLARFLKKVGCKPDDVIGILSHRSLELMVGIMGVLKAGAAYLPINPDYPRERIEYMLQNSTSTILLSEKEYVERVTVIDKVVNLNDNTLYQGDDSNLEPINSAQNLAYVIYTSGSTGLPKGVMIEHRSLINYVTSIYNEFNGELGEADICLSVANISFDASVCEIFCSLLTGASLVLYPENKLDSFTLVKTLLDEGITLAFIPPSILRDVYEGLKGVKERVKLNKLRVGVEPIKDYVLQGYLELNDRMKILNGYGPTEATICSTIYQYKSREVEGNNIPIGKPLGNTRIYILDRDNQLAPIGIPGEICIAGDGVARGYINNPDLTADKFVANPFNPEERMYRTGDLGKWMADGNIQFIGRVDHQVKIRGYRIEPGEIENQILKDSRIKRTVVVDQTDTEGNKYLCAYLEVKGGKSIALSEEPEIKEQKFITELRAELTKRLPDYMVPAYFVIMESIPFTLSGKVDRKALPTPEKNFISGTEYVAPKNFTEKKLTEIWSEILGVEKIGINDNFFESGGHSLKATLLVSRIMREFNVQIPINTIFNAPTIKELSQYIIKATGVNYSPIQVVKKKDYYPLSSAQRRLFFLNQLNPDSTDYNIPGVFILEGEIDVEWLRTVFKTIVKRHDSFRTSFDFIAGEPVQKVYDEVVFDITELNPEIYQMKTEEEIIKEMMKDFVQPFDLTKAPLLKVALLKINQSRYILLIDMHHIISDGFSVDILRNEFIKLYQKEVLPEVKIQYKDFVEWQNNLLQSEEIKKQEKYWLKIFQGDIPVLNLPGDYIHPSEITVKGGTYTFSMPELLSNKLKKFSIMNKTSLYITLLAIYNILLSRYSNQEDIVMGMPIAGRRHTDVENIIGMFVNTLALRNFPAKDKVFKEFLEEVNTSTINAYENQDYQFEMLVEKLGLANSNGNPLFNVTFVLQNATGNLKLQAGNLKVTPYQFSNQVSKFDLTLNGTETEKGIDFDLIYSTRLFKKETIKRMARHFINIAEEVVNDPLIRLNQIKMLSREELEWLVYGLNDTQREFSSDKTIHQIFEEQVEKTPDSLALLSKTGQLTYRELNKRVNQLTHYLRKKGVTANQVIGLMVERSFEMIIGILAILKAGGGYLPIDLNYPKDRIEHILQDSGTNILVVNDSRKENIDFKGELIDLRDQIIFKEEDSNPEIINNSRDLAYLLYTSGSTGLPKGVMIEHRSVINTISHLQNRYPLGEDDIVLQSTVYTFDASVREIFWWFFNGACCFILKPGGEKDPSGIIGTIDKYKITIAKFVPVLLNEILLEAKEGQSGKLSSLKYVFVGGEALTGQVIDRFYEVFQEGQVLGNLYGPTETTIHCTEYEITGPIKEPYAPIGKPISNNRVYVLDEMLQPVPPGVVGEIYIAGIGVGREYLNNPELTRKSFIPDPFVPGERMYKSGDLGRWLMDGNLEFMSRRDHQVKIRGYRIELGEIENHLLNHETVTNAVVLAHTDSYGEKYLCAYLEVRSFESVSRTDNTQRKNRRSRNLEDEHLEVNEEIISRLKKYLGEKLPEFMIPTQFVLLEKFPLLANGKVNRKALPKPDKHQPVREYVEPTSELEKRLAAIWSILLRKEKIGVIDDFFETGGHSLKAASLRSRVYKEFEIDIPLKVIFNNPTIKQLAEFIKTTEKITFREIKPVERREYYQLSSAQKRIYVLNQFGIDNTNYNMPGAISIEGDLNKNSLEDAFRKLINRHEAFRTSFRLVSGEPVQLIHDRVGFTVNFYSLEEIRASLDSKETLLDKDIISKIFTEFVKPFDLSKAPLLRVGLINVTDNKHILLFDMHHIISDGVSMGILVKEFFELYQGRELADLKIHYKDFAQWQNHLLASEVIEREEKYWLDLFSDEIPVLNLPTDYPESPVISSQGERVSFEIDGYLTAKLKEIGSQKGATLFMTLLSLLNILLSRYSGQDDIIVGTPVAGRDHPYLEKIIGMFVNTLPLRICILEEKSFIEFLKEVRERTLEAFENQNYQFEMLVEKLDLTQSLRGNPLFEVMFVLQNTAESFVNEIDCLGVKQLEVQNNTAKFNLTFNVVEERKKLNCLFEYKTDLFKQETIERMVGHLIQIIHEIVENPEIKIKDIEMITPDEKEQLLTEFCGTEIHYKGTKTIHQIFEEEVFKHPDKTALIFENKQMTYNELNAKANQLAHKLREKGVRRDTIIGLMVERSFEMIIGILGVLKSGGAYIPIDPDYPEDRIKYILEDSKTQILITMASLTKKVEFTGDIINLTREGIFTGNAKNLENVNELTDLAYVMYTSGTTGKPKGNLTCHKNIIRVVKETNYIEIKPEDKVLQLSTYAFDGSTFDTYGGLLNGASLVLINKDILLDLKKLTGLIQRETVTVFFITTTLFNMIIDINPDSLKGVRKVLVGGERLSVPHMAKGLKHLGAGRLINGYGPTESTVFATTYAIDKLEKNCHSIPIGRPISYTGVYILNRWDKLQPIGVVGELCITGDGLARGYLNQPELTAEKFVPNPFIPGTLMYRTGDLVRWLPDGNIEFIGRKDNQVKIRGFRIELGEIEERLLSHPDIQKAVVLDKVDKGGNKYLCGYLEVRSTKVKTGQILDVESDNGEINPEPKGKDDKGDVNSDFQEEIGKKGTEIEMETIRQEEEKVFLSNLRKFLAKELPEYMVPSHFMVLAKFPLNASGKIDRKALPEPDENNLVGREYIAPTSGTEEKLVRLWSEILGIPGIGINDNFFELGGHSLKAMLMVSRISKELNVELPIRVIFERQTIKELGEYIDSAEKIFYAEIKPIKKLEGYPEGCFPTSSAQKRLYIQNQFEGVGVSYNMPGALILEGELEESRFKQVFKQLIARHETLRTSFDMLNDEIVQKISPRVELPIIIREIQELEVEQAFREFVRPFDLHSAPLLRIELLKLTGSKQIMFFDMHHIISDGVSIENLIREFVALYQGEDLPEPRVQYKDFAVWQNDLFKTGGIEDQRGYWLEVFQGEVPVLDMPTDFPRPSIQSFKGKRYQWEISREMTASLKDLAQKRDSTLYMVLLAAYNVLLAKYTGQEDLVIGSPIAGRRHADLQKMLGMFVNMLALRNQPYRNMTFSDFLSQVRENTLKAFENQDYQFEELVEELHLSRDMSRNALFDVVFSLQDASNHRVIETDGLRLIPYNFEGNISKFDLTLEVVLESAGMLFNVEYCTDLFTESRIRRFAGHFQQILKQITTNPDITLKEIDILTEAEKIQIQNEFNATKMEFPMDKTLHELFAEQVLRTPDKVALVDGDKSWTYQELDIRTNQLARQLRKSGVGPDQLVAIMAERSGEMIMGILAVLKAGGAYLPINPGYPEERIKFMLADSQAKIILIHSQDSRVYGYKEIMGYNSNIQGGQPQIIDLSDERIYSGKGESLSCINKSLDLAYVMYTSGSTGKPKGVMITHRSVVNLSKYYNQLFELELGKNILHMSDVSFDTSVVEIFPPLIYGSTIYVVGKELALNSEKFMEYVQMKEINFAQFVPMTLKEILSKGTKPQSLDNVIVGGDKLDDTLKDQILSQGYRLTNHYGPTETTVDAIVAICKKGVSTIGKPIANTRVHIIDKDGHLAPIGVPGEICISGMGLAKGYLNRPELTAEKFVLNPMVSSERFYRTGDLGRWMEDGNLEFLGRIDYQVKIRGYRIEPGEIENQILKNNRIQDAVVIDHIDSDGNRYLCAYLVAADIKSKVNVEEMENQTPEPGENKAISEAIAGQVDTGKSNRDDGKWGGVEQEIIGELRNSLTQSMPDYMIPAYFIILDSIPLTPNGKVDRKALPLPDKSYQVGTEYVAPSNRVEEKLVNIWSEILNREKIGITDNFFELGGHSLKIIAMISRILKELNVEIPMQVVFKKPTIKELAEYISSAEKTFYSTIQPVEKIEGYPEGYYPASSAQKRLYIQNQFEGIGVSYNMPGALIIEGELDQERFKEVFRQLVARHETLRTSFEMVNGEIVQRIAQVIELPISVKEIQESEVEQAFTDFVRPFDLESTPLFRIELIKVSEGKEIMFFDMHHIISDGVSVDNLISEFVTLYHGVETLPELKIQYKDFAFWQNKLFKTGAIEAQKIYWLEKFKGEIPILNMPTDFPRPAIQSFKGGKHEFQISGELMSSIRELAVKTGSTLYMVFLAVFNILLSKYTGQEDLIVGSPIAGRNHADLEKIIGMFVNMLVLRNKPSGSLSYVEFLAMVREDTLKAFLNQDYQFEELVEELNLQRDLSRNPLFDVVFGWQEAKQGKELKAADLRFIPYTFKNNISKFDLKLEGIDEHDRIWFIIEYCADLFEKERMERLATHFVQILNQITANPEIPLREIEILSKAEKTQILVEFNKTEMEFPEKTLHELIDQQVERTPDKIALVYEGQEWTYREMNDRANQLGWKLRKLGVQPDDLIPIIADRSDVMVIAILGVLKAGGAYVPINPDYPVERIAYMLKDSQARILLTQKSYLKRVTPEEIQDISENKKEKSNELLSQKTDLRQAQQKFLEYEKIQISEIYQGQIIDLNDAKTWSEKGDVLENINKPTDLAYVIYTSGSTGKPKGVMIEHRSVVSLAKYLNQRFKLSEGKNILHSANICFDISVAEIFPPLIYGSRIFVLDKELNLDRERYMEYVRENKINFAQFVPATLQEILARSAKPDSLDMIVVVGDKLDGSLKDRVLSLGYCLNDHYGPTEATVYATTARCEKGRSTIGRPLANTKIYIVNKDNQLAPIGVPGELCISGIGLARGYLNRPELTAEKFVTNMPFTQKRIYRTGDLASWQADGNITFHGRIDNQVKIRGYRIEPGEIEAKLLKHKAISEGVVIERIDSTGEKYLCAYFTADQKLSTAELRAYLLQELPEYMVPAYFVQLDSLPLNPSGKVDRKALPEVETVSNSGTDYLPPTNEVEERLLKIWEQVLGIQGIGITHKFFEVGGQSLKGIQIVNLIHKEFNIQISLSDVFKYPTIKELSDLLKNTVTSEYSEIQKLPEQEYYELSYNQKRLWIINQLEPDSIAYNLSGKFTINDQPDKKLIIKIFNQLVNRHESLRTYFKVVEGRAVQVIDGEKAFNLQVFDLLDLDKVEKEVEREVIIQKITARPFDLEAGPPIRAALIILEKDKFEIVFCMHHIISDGWSMEILKSEFNQMYSGYREGKKWAIEALEIQYKDFAAWQNTIISDVHEMEKVKDFWRSRLSGGFPVLNLPTDYSNSENKDSAAYRMVISKEIKEELQVLANNHKSSLFVVLITILEIFLADLTGQEKIAVGFPGSGRQHQSLNKVIGFFINTLLLVNKVKDGVLFEELLQIVNRDTLLALEFQNYPLELIIDELNIKYPRIQVFFNMLNMGDTHIQRLNDMTSYHIEKTQDSKFDLSFYVIEYANGLEINCVYLKGLYKPSTIEFIMGEYLRLIEKILGYEKDEGDDFDDDLLFIRD